MDYKNKEENNLYAEVSIFKEYFDDIKSFFNPVDIMFLEKEITEIYEMNIGNTDCIRLILDHHQDDIIKNHLKTIKQW